MSKHYRESSKSAKVDSRAVAKQGVDFTKVDSRGGAKVDSSKSAKVDSSNENDLELFDMLCVALHFAGVKRSGLKQILQAYIDELDNFDDEAPYGQEEIIAIIHTLQAKYPESFHTSSSEK